MSAYLRSGSRELSVLRPGIYVAESGYLDGSPGERTITTSQAIKGSSKNISLKKRNDAEEWYNSTRRGSRPAGSKS